jgi:hypothetical protein
MPVVIAMPRPKRRRRRSPPKTSAVEKTAVRIVRKLYKATGGQPQRRESLGNLGAVKADAAGIAYAVERSHPFAIKAIASISMRAPSRSPATWTALDVGGLCGKTSPRTLENSA